MASASGINPIFLVGSATIRAVAALGDVTLYARELVHSLFRGFPPRRVLMPIAYEIGVRSVAVVLITGTFLGMVLAVQAFNQFRLLHMESRLGAVITMTLVAELGPVLAATMLAGRIGSAMAARLGTMQVSEQIDALRALGADPVSHLAVPRLLACVLLIPALTAFADMIGILSGWLFSTFALGVNSEMWWRYAEDYVTAWDVVSGLVKSVFFGAAIAVIACHRGFRCTGGADGVGRAATESFVWSFIAILAIDFVLTVCSNTLYSMIWPPTVLM